MNGYKAFYNGRTKDVYAVNQLQARTKAVDHFKVPRSKEHMVSVMLCEKDVAPETGKGTQVTHSTASVG